MNYALIFAGGVGQRMNTVSLPKQFLVANGKPIIVHTIEHFQNCNEIKGIIISCLPSFVNYMKDLVKKFYLTKVLDIVPGGNCGQDSIYNGLYALSKFAKSKDDIVLIHDGVRPLIDDKTIKDNIECVREKGNAVTVAKAIETIVLLDKDGNVESVEDRTKCNMARAPQSFFFKDIYAAHLKAIAENKHDFIDSAMMMSYYGCKLHTVLGPANNIKVTTPMDFYMLKAILDAKENSQIKEKQNGK